MSHDNEVGTLKQKTSEGGATMNIPKSPILVALTLALATPVLAQAPQAPPSALDPNAQTQEAPEVNAPQNMEQPRLNETTTMQPQNPTTTEPTDPLNQSPLVDPATQPPPSDFVTAPVAPTPEDDKVNDLNDQSTTTETTATTVPVTVTTTTAPETPTSGGATATSGETAETPDPRLLPQTAGPLGLLALLGIGGAGSALGLRAARRRR